MPHITCTLDPISMTDIGDPTGHPYVHEGHGEDELTVYFESEANRQAYLATPLEHPCEDIGVDMSNPNEEGIDNG